MRVLLLTFLLPATLAAQEPQQIALLRGQVGVDPEAGSLLATPARLTVSGLLLSDALTRLSQRSRVQIAFSPTLLPQNHRVRCDCAALITARALDQLLAGTDLGYVELGSQIVVVPRVERGIAPDQDGDVRGRVHAETTLTGIVRDSVSLEPVAFARVTVTPLGSEAAVASGVSDRYGAFVLPAVPASVPVRIDAGTFGYAWTRTYDAPPSDPVRALLGPRPIGLEHLYVASDGRPGDPISSSRDAFIVDTALLRGLPAMLEADVGHATAVSPSASAPSDYSSLPYIRGGSSHGTPVLLDGMRLFNAFHLGGFISAINPEVVKSATVLAGPGEDHLAVGSLSGAIDIATRDGARDRRRTSGSLGIASSRVSVEGPVGGSVSYLIGARRSHPGVLLGLVARGLEKSWVFDRSFHYDPDDLHPYSFHDLYAKVTTNPGGVRRFSVSSYLNSESLQVHDPGPRRTLGLEWGNAAVSVHYRDRLGDNGILDVNLGHSRFRSDLLALGEGVAPSVGADGDSIKYKPPTGTLLFGDGSMSETRADVRARWHAGRATITVGTQATRFHGHHAYSLEEAGIWGVWGIGRAITDVLPRLALRDIRWRLAAYSSVDVPLRSGFSTRGGLRIDRFKALATTLAPFAELSYTASWWSARISGSRSHQALASLRNEETLLASLLSYDLLLPVGEAPVPQNTEFSIGWEGTRGRQRVRLDAYRRTLDHLRLADPGANPGTGTVLADTSLWELATGTARGIEATWSWAWDRGVSVLGSYRWASVSRTVGSRTYTPRFHRDHEFELGSSYRRGASSWSAQLSLGSGQPDTPWLVVVRGPQLRRDEPDGYRPHRAVLLGGEYNSAKLPYYARLDIGWRRESAVSWFGGGSVVPYVTVANLLNRRNVVGWRPALENTICLRTCPDPVPDHRAYRRQLPMIPFIGVEFRF